MRRTLLIAPDVFTASQERPQGVVQHQLECLAAWVRQHPILRVARLRGAWDMRQAMAGAGIQPTRLAPLLDQGFNVDAAPATGRIEDGRAALRDKGIFEPIEISAATISLAGWDGKHVAPTCMREAAHVIARFRELSTYSNVIHVIDGYGVRFESRNVLEPASLLGLRAIATGVAEGRAALQARDACLVVMHLHESGAADRDWGQVPYEPRGGRASALLRCVRGFAPELQATVRDVAPLGHITLRLAVWPRHFHDRWLLCPDNLKVVLSNGIKEACVGEAVWASSVEPCAHGQPPAHWTLARTTAVQLTEPQCTYPTMQRVTLEGQGWPDYAWVHDYALA